MKWNDRIVRRVFRSSLAIALFLSSFVAQAAPVSGQIHQSQQSGHLYIWISDLTSWDGAIASASNFATQFAGNTLDQWHVVTITSAEENEFIWTTVLNSDTAIGEVWLGGVIGNSGQFEWLTGEEFGYSNFAEDQPDFAHETVLEMGGQFGANQSGALWNNEDRELPAPGAAPQSFVIEHSAVIPVPAAVWLLGSALAAIGWLRRRQAAVLAL